MQGKKAAATKLRPISGQSDSGSKFLGMQPNLDLKATAPRKQDPREQTASSDRYHHGEGNGIWGADCKGLRNTSTHASCISGPRAHLVRSCVGSRKPDHT